MCVMYYIINILQLQSVPGGNFDRDFFSVPVRVFDPLTTYTCNKTVDTLTGLVGISIEFSYKNDPQTNIIYNVSVLIEQSDGSPGLQVARFIYDSEASLTNEVITNDVIFVSYTSEFFLL